MFQKASERLFSISSQLLYASPYKWSPSIYRVQEASTLYKLLADIHYLLVLERI